MPTMTGYRHVLLLSRGQTNSVTVACPSLDPTLEDSWPSLAKQPECQRVYGKPWSLLSHRSASLTPSYPFCVWQSTWKSRTRDVRIQETYLRFCLQGRFVKTRCWNPWWTTGGLHPKPTPGPGGVLETKGKFSIRNFQPLESLNPITMELAFWKFVELYRYLVFQKGFDIYCRYLWRRESLII